MSEILRYLIIEYIFIIEEDTVTWLFKKAKLVTLLTTEAEYMALTHVVSVLELETSRTI